MQIRKAIKPTLYILGILLLVPLLISKSNVDVNEQIEQIRAYSRKHEFEYLGWSVDAVWEKLQMYSLGLPKRLPQEQTRGVIDQTMHLAREIRILENEINQNLADPATQTDDMSLTDLFDELQETETNYRFFAAVSETIFEQQISEVLTQNQLSFSGQPMPPVLFRFSPLPKALIVSPRHVIRQDANLSLTPDLTLETMLDIEQQIAEDLNVSTYVTDIGGVGTYPAMVMQSFNLEWLISTVAHEWAHNFLTLRPLGVNYGTSAELRTINETTADIVGYTVQYGLISLHYPELLPNLSTPLIEQPQPERTEEPAFDFAYEMYLTRTEVDRLLAIGSIEEAEEYMEMRRLFFWENGYRIRKLNQAYFAFHSAYVNAPSTGEEGQTGAAGQDPVGPAVWQLFENSPSLKSFLQQVAWLTSFEQLEARLTAP
jgi:hypothetical protein